MIITEIKQQVNDKKRVSVYIDGKFAFGLSNADRLFYKLEEGKELSKEKYAEIMEENVYERAKNKAARFLGHRMRSEKELRVKLREEFAEGVIDRVIELFKGYGYVDDEEFALCYAKDCINIKKWGRNRIRNELRLKGISSSYIESAIEKTRDEESTRETIKRLLDKRIKNTPIDFKEKQKHFAFLVRRGFSSDDIAACLDEYCR